MWVLVQVNSLANPHIVYVGQQLVIPISQAAASAEEMGNTDAAPTPTPPPASPMEAAPDSYVVHPGDTLYRIAKRFGTTTAALANLNGITNPSTIYAGQVLRLSGETTAPAGGARRILVDLSEQHLYAYQGDQLIYSFVASSGAAPTYTRTGQFHVQSKIPNAYGATWNIWMPHWLGIYWAGGSENGIHALPILPNGQTLWAGYLGTPVSYGCIVLGTYEAKLLYDWAEFGTPVTIQP
jgi:LysM repeat protein